MLGDCDCGLDHDEFAKFAKQCLCDVKSSFCSHTSYPLVTVATTLKIV